MKKMLVFLIVLVFSTSIVFAQTDKNNSMKQEEVNARYNFVGCRVDLLVSQADILKDFGNISTEKLTSDFSDLKSFADSADFKGFNAGVANLNKDAAKVNQELGAAKANFAKLTVSDDTKKGLRDDWNSALDAFKTCNVESRRSVIATREQVLQNEIARWNQIIVRMNSTGHDTLEMEKVLIDANNLLLSLKNATNNLNDTEFKALMDDLNDRKLHLHARFALSRIKSFNENTKVMASTMEISVTDVNLTLPTRKYDSGEFEKEWQMIREADAKALLLRRNVTDLQNERRLITTRNGSGMINNNTPVRSDNWTRTEQSNVSKRNRGGESQ